MDGCRDSLLFPGVGALVAILLLLLLAAGCGADASGTGGELPDQLSDAPGDGGRNRGDGLVESRADVPPDLPPFEYRIPDLKPGEKAVLLAVEPPSKCGCAPSQPGIPDVECGWYLGRFSLLKAHAKVVSSDPAFKGEVDRVELHAVVGGEDVLLDVDDAPGPDGEAFLLGFEAAELPGGMGLYEHSRQQEVFTVVARAQTDDGEELETTRAFAALVDAVGPDLLIESPNQAGLASLPYEGSLPYSLQAGDPGSGLAEIHVALGFEEVKVFEGEEMATPWVLSKYEGTVQYSAFDVPYAELEVTALDCLENSTTRKVLVPLASASAEEGEKLIVPCGGLVPGSETIVGLVAGFGDKDDAHPDLIMSTSLGVRVAWGGPNKPFGKLNLQGDWGAMADARFIDATGDAVPDIVTLKEPNDKLPHRLQVWEQDSFEGKGVRAFHLAEEWPVGELPFMLAAADVNQDGRMDLFVADKSEEHSVALAVHAQSGGSLYEVPVFLTGVGEITWMVPADVNQDSFPDLVMARGKQAIISVFLNDGTGGFPMAHNTVLLDKDVPFFAAEELDGDSQVDVLGFVRPLKTAYLLPGKGDGYFDGLALGTMTLEEFAQGGMSGVLSPKLGSSTLPKGGKLLSCSQSSNAMVVRDFSGDGIPDFAMSAGEDDMVQMYAGAGDGTFKEWYFMPAGDQPWSLSSEDFDLDGTPDLAMLQGKECQALVLMVPNQKDECVPEGWCCGAPSEPLVPGGDGCTWQCACVCTNPKACTWKCQWVLDGSVTCPPAGPCDGFPDGDCQCTQSCACQCDLVGTASCKWKNKVKLIPGKGDCPDEPADCLGPGSEQCACKQVCQCSCSGSSQAECVSGGSWDFVGQEVCAGEGKCAGGTCGGLGQCQGEGLAGQQCVCGCGCQCDCQCDCQCAWDGTEADCAWGCKAKCAWDCQWKSPPPPKPKMLWSESLVIPMPVKPDVKGGRIVPERIAVSDFDGDGLKDIAVLTESFALEDQLGQSHKPRLVALIAGKTPAVEALQMQISVTRPNLVMPVAGFAASNLNGDPFPDLLVLVQQYTWPEGACNVNLDLLLGGRLAGEIAPGQFGPGIHCPLPYAGASPGWFTTSGGYCLEMNPQGMALAPLDGGNPLDDLIVAAEGQFDPGAEGFTPDRIGIHLTRTQEKWSACSYSPVVHFEGCPPLWVCADEFCADDPEGIHCLPATQVTEPLTGTSPASVAAADIDNDGTLDVLAANRETGNVSVLRGTSAAGEYLLAAPGKPPMLLAAGEGLKEVAAGDLDGDGWADLVFSLPGKVAVALSLQGEAFSAPSYVLPQLVGLNPTRLIVADINADGRADIAGLDDNASFAFCLLAAPGLKFVGPFLLPTAKDPVDLAVTDLDGDGCLDFVTANQDSKSLSVIINTRCDKY